MPRNPPFPHMASIVDLVQHTRENPHMLSKKNLGNSEIVASNSGVFRAGINRKHVFAMIPIPGRSHSLIPTRKTPEFDATNSEFPRFFFELRFFFESICGFSLYAERDLQCWPRAIASSARRNKHLRVDRVPRCRAVAERLPSA